MPCRVMASGHGRQSAESTQARGSLNGTSIAQQGGGRRSLDRRSTVSRSGLIMSSILSDSPRYTVNWDSGQRPLTLLCTWPAQRPLTLLCTWPAGEPRLLSPAFLPVDCSILTGFLSMLRRGLHISSRTCVVYGVFNVAIIFVFANLIVLHIIYSGLPITPRGLTTSMWWQY